MQNLNHFLSFVNFLNQYRKIERKTYANGSDHMENDAEHAFQLAMVVWFATQHFNLDLDQGKLLKFALAHDLVETFAGDTPFLDQQAAKDQSRRENEALERIGVLFGETFPDLKEVIGVYEREKKDGKEASFVYALDKLLPMLNIYLDQGRTWKDLYPQLNLEKAIQLKNEKIRFSPKILAVFQELTVLLLEERENLFINGGR